MKRDKLGRFKKGFHHSFKTEFKKGKHFSPKTEFKKGMRVSKKTEFKKIFSNKELKERKLIYSKWWRQKNKEKVYAQVKARKIKIPKGQICQECHKRKATIKHHDDYSKPLDVKYVCYNCHNKRIKNNGNFIIKYHKKILKLGKEKITKTIKKERKMKNEKRKQM